MPIGKRPLESRRRRWEDNFGMDQMVIGVYTEGLG